MAENLNEIAAWRGNWIDSLSDEQKATLQADRAAYANEETKAERMAELAATFQTNDTNADGLLDRAEMEGFMRALKQNGEARGVPTMDTENVDDAMKDKAWAFYNSITADVEGVSMADFAAGTQQIGAAIKAMAGQ